MAKQSTGEMLILGTKQSCTGYLLRLRIKVINFILESLEKSKVELGRLHIIEVIETRVFHSGLTARLTQGV